MNKIHMGSFNAESFWRPNNLSVLPTVVDKTANNMVHAMDEILFALAKSKDIIFTFFPFDKTLKNYLNSVGFHFSCVNAGSNYFNNSDIIDTFSDFRYDFHSNYLLELYGVTNKDAAKISSSNIIVDYPDFEIVAKVNSKAYSTEISSKLDCNIISSVVVYSFDELVKHCKKINKDFLIKDLYGVSGKGIIKITSSKTLDSVLRYLNTQRKKGKDISFVVEPFVIKNLDFSSHF